MKVATVTARAGPDTANKVVLPLDYGPRAQTIPLVQPAASASCRAGIARKSGNQERADAGFRQITRLDFSINRI